MTPSCLSALILGLLLQTSYSSSGHQSRTERKTIVGGEEVPLGGYPSYAVYGDFSRNRENLCGGVLIHPDILITAAHCFFREGDRFILGRPLYLGGNKLDRSDARETIPVSAVLRHPDFRPNFEPSHDIMLLKLQTPSTAPIFRINGDPLRPRDNENLVVVGFGGDQRVRVYPTLMQAVVNAANFESCDRDYSGNLERSVQVCAGGGVTDSCFNDSGGPLLAMDGTLMGVVSFGEQCGGPVPAVYARLNTAAAFIQAGICEMSASPPGFCPGSVVPVLPNPPVVPRPSPVIPAPTPLVASPPTPTWTIFNPRPPIPASPPQTTPTWVLLTNPTPTAPPPAAPTRPTWMFTPFTNPTVPPPTPPSWITIPNPQPTAPPPPPPVVAPTAWNIGTRPTWTTATSPTWASFLKPPSPPSITNPVPSTPSFTFNWGPSKPSSNLSAPPKPAISWTTALSPSWASAVRRDSLPGESSQATTIQSLVFVALMIVLVLCSSA